MNRLTSKASPGCGSSKVCVPRASRYGVISADLRVTVEPSPAVAVVLTSRAARSDVLSRGTPPFW